MSEFEPFDGAHDRSSPGQILAAARKRQNLSLADVTRQLRLSERQLRALEADAYGELPGATFVRGFIRNYARLLRLDPEPLLRALEPSPPPVVESPHEAAPKPRVGWLYAVGALALVLVIAIYFGGGDEAGETPVAVPTLTEAPKPVAAREPAPLPVTEPSFGGTPPQDDIKLVFKRESFVEIRDATGKPILNKSNPAGSTQTIIGKPPYSLVIGNAEHVQMTYQGENIDLGPHTKSGVARLVLN
ncbi:MAG: helix-turn-helix domain-containing protein [Burkholderiales bacterium]